MASFEEIRCSECTNSAMAEKAFSGVYTPSGWHYKKGYYFCTKGCLDRFNASKESGASSEKNTSNPEADAQKAEADARKAEAKAQQSSAKWNALAEMGSSLLASTNQDAREVKEITDYISKIVFSSNADELGNQLSEISSLWAGGNKYTNSDYCKAVKKAAFEKFEFGMMKFKQVGDSSQIEFFEKKQKEMKPKKFLGLF